MGCVVDLIILRAGASQSMLGALTLLPWLLGRLFSTCTDLYGTVATSLDPVSYSLGTSDLGCALGIKYAGIKVMGTSLLVSISKRSPMCRGDCLVEELPGNLKVLGGVVIIVASPPISNCFTISSILSCSDIHLFRTITSNASKNYKIRKSNRSTRTPMVFIVSV